MTCTNCVYLSVLFVLVVCDLHTEEVMLLHWFVCLPVYGTVVNIFMEFPITQLISLYSASSYRHLLGVACSETMLKKPCCEASLERCSVNLIVCQFRYKTVAYTIGIDE